MMRANEIRSAAQRRQLYNVALQGFTTILHKATKEATRKAAKSKVDEINQQLIKMDPRDF
jgi:hypothetical protein